MWGQVFTSSKIHIIRRIIPTRVGTSIPSSFYFIGTRDHPHACGDKMSAFSSSQSSRGSSPRVWGQGTIACVRCHRTRIIPTRVGTRANVEYNFTSGEDHPHACGDKGIISLDRIFLSGSSPRVWGQAPLFSPPCNIFRIIPTRVGTSALCTSSCEDTKDHPHACGDKAIITRRRNVGVGSSPRVWGQVF